MPSSRTSDAEGKPCLVEVKAVSLSIEGRQILSDVSLQLSERRIGLIGRNGSGKSSLARVICGLIAPQDGSVLVNGVNVEKDRKGALSEVGIIFQNPDHQIIFPTVEEEIAFGPRQQGHSKEGAKDIAHAELTRFDVPHWAERPVAELSQGQKHLVCLMSVLAMRPAVIVLDEPFTGLDYPTSQQLRRYLSGIDETVLHITHDLEALEQYDRVIWIDEGTVKEDGAPEEVIPSYTAAMKALGEGTDAVADITR